MINTSFPWTHALTLRFNFKIKSYTNILGQKPKTELRDVLKYLSNDICDLIKTFRSPVFAVTFVETHPKRLVYWDMRVVFVSMRFTKNRKSFN